LVIESAIYLKKEKILSFYQKDQVPSLYEEIEDSLKRIKFLLKEYGEKYIVLWIIFAEIEYKKSNLPRL